MAIVIKFVKKLKTRVKERKNDEKLTVKPFDDDVVLDDEDIKAAEDYFFKKCTKEVKQFSKHSDWKKCSTEKDGILYFEGRVLDGQSMNDVENVFMDIEKVY